MFCNNCGKQNPDNSAFCSGCGARFTPPAQQQYQQPPIQQYQPQYQQPPVQQYQYPQPVQQTPPKKSKSLMITGIILLVLGILANIGCAANGTYADFAAGMDVSNIVTLSLLIAMPVSGIAMIIKNVMNK